jgi:hypothetical protein
MFFKFIKFRIHIVRQIYIINYNDISIELLYRKRYLFNIIYLRNVVKIEYFFKFFLNNTYT